MRPVGHTTVKCWGIGSGALGQDSLGDNLGDEPGEMAALQPVDLGAGRTATAVSAGGGHMCALLDNAWVKCWGRNQAGQLGQPGTNVGTLAGDMAALQPILLQSSGAMTVAETADETSVGAGRVR